MSDELLDIQNVTHIYRQQLAEIEKRNGKSTQDVVDDPFKTRGHEREKLERIDADLTAAERSAHARSLDERLAKLEQAPQFATRATKSSGVAGDANSAEFSARWLHAGLTGNQAELRVLTNGSTSGAPVPTDMERRVVQQLYLSSAIRQLAKVNTIDSKRTVTVETGIPTGYLVGETSDATLSDPSYRAVSVAPYKMVAATKMSQEFVEDAIGTGAVGTALDYVANRLATGIGRICESYFTTGTGSSQPQGIGSCQSATWASTNSSGIINQGVTLTEDQTVANITADNLIDTVFAVPAQYRNSPRYQILTSDACLKAIRKLKNTGFTTSSGAYATDYLWTPGTTGNTVNGGYPATICGVPYTIGEYVPSTAAQATTTANVRGSALFIVGHWDFFEVFDRTGMGSLFDPYSSSLSLQSTLYMWLRTDSRIMNPSAFAAIYSPNAS